MKPLIFLSTILLFAVLLYFKFENQTTINKLKNDVENANFELMNLKETKLQENNKLKERITIEYTIDSQQINVLKNNTKIIYYYLPKSICNECMTGVYNVFKNESKNDNLKVIILSPASTFRYNKAFFVDYGFEVCKTNLNLNYEPEYPFIFRFFNNALKNIKIIDNKDISSSKTYFRTILKQIK